MSHVSTYKTRIANLDIFKKVCIDHDCTIYEGETVKMFANNKVDAALGVKIPGWKYMIAVTEDGELKYDNFGSQSGSMDTLGEIIQSYNLESIQDSLYGAQLDSDAIENHYVEEQANGTLKLVVEYQ